MRSCFRHALCHFLGLLLVSCTLALAQVEENQNDAFIPHEDEGPRQRPKVNHAEPLFIDLIRDLGARKGEREWNLGFGHNDVLDYDEYTALIEYEWAVIDRLGLEIELPFTYKANNGRPTGEAPVRDLRRQRGIESLKLAAQWSFAVFPKAQTTLALGYIHEFLIPSFRDLGSHNLHQGNLYNPFFIGAKHWGRGFHSLVYTGPRFHHDWGGSWHRNGDYRFDTEGIHSPAAYGAWHTSWEINTNLHYMLPGTRNFVGVEINQLVTAHELHTVLRPQMRIVLSETLILGLVASIPLDRQHEGLGAFTRLIYEPPHKHHRPRKH